MKNYTCNEVNTFLIDYIEYHKQKNDIPYHISLGTLKHIFDEIIIEYNKLEYNRD